jgi:hypothetical protein
MFILSCHEGFGPIVLGKGKEGVMRGPELDKKDDIPVPVGM